MRMISHERFKELANEANTATRNGLRASLTKGVFGPEHENLMATGYAPDYRLVFLKSTNRVIRAEGNRVFLIATNGEEHCFTFSKEINFEADA